jgi:two-component system sensor histidine kinase EvgS
MKTTWTNLFGHVAYWMAATLIILMGWLFYQSGLKSNKSALATEHTLEMQQIMVQVSEAMFRAASAQRAYLLSGDEGFVEERLQAQRGGDRELTRLAQLAWDPAVTAAIAHLQSSITRRFGEMMAVPYRNDGSGPARAIEDAKEMAILDDEIEALEQSELGLLKAHRAQERAFQERSSNLLGIAILACALIMIPGYVAFIVYGRARQRAQLLLLKSKEAAETASRAKSTFLATVSHEIRTPMNGVLGMLELLSLTELDREQRTTLEVVRESGKSLLRIIDDILDFSKIEAGKLTIVPEAVSVEEIVASVYSIYSGNASSKGLVIKSYVDPGISAAVVVDPVRLQQVLRNFVMNSIKFTHQGYIEIRAELLERLPGTDVVRFSVKDTGIGISREDQGRLFQPFVQAGEGVSRQAGGTGLGLSICQRLAALMGGSVDISSAPGHGTTLYLTLPLATTDVAALLKRKDSSEQMQQMHKDCRVAPGVADAAAEGTLVLIADDHPINRLVLMRQVNSLGYATEVAEQGVAALAKWDSHRFGLVITDCNMPEMDGFELVRRIREREAAGALGRTPIIACTANAMEGEAGKCFAAGMDDYLAKPIELARLQKKLDRWLPIPRQAMPKAAPAIDPAVLDEFSGGDNVVRLEILQQFRVYNDKDGAQLKLAMQEGDLALVTRTSHRIKGASRTIGAMDLASVCERIEAAGRANDTHAVAANADAFTEELDRLNACIGTT